MQVLADGIISGFTIAALALGFAVVYVPSGVFHVALGGVYVIVPFVAWTCLVRGYPAPVAFGAAVGVGVGLSTACEYVNHWRLEAKGAASGSHLIASLGIYIVLAQSASMIWGTETKVLRSGVDPVVKLGGVVLTAAQTIGASACVAALVAFCAWLRLTDLGLRFRALAENPTEFALRGYSVRKARLLAFAVSGLLAAVSSLAVANDIGFEPSRGLAALLLAVVAVIIGGRTTFAGAFFGGVLLGIVRSEVAWFLSSRWVEVTTFMLLAVFLFLRPNGIVGRAGRLDAEG